MKKFIAILDDEQYFYSKIVEATGYMGDSAHFIANIAPEDTSFPPKGERTYSIEQCFDTIEAAKLYLLETRLKEAIEAKTKAQRASFDQWQAEDRLAALHKYFVRLQKGISND